MNSPETQKSFIGSGLYKCLWSQRVARMTSQFPGIDHPWRHVASLTDFPSAFSKKLLTSASLPEGTQPTQTTAEARVDCCVLGKTCIRDAGRIQSSDAETATQAATSQSCRSSACIFSQTYQNEPGRFVNSAQLHVEDHPPQKPVCPQ